MADGMQHENLTAYVDGEFVPWRDAKVHVFSPLVKYGASAFEGVRGYWSESAGQMNLFRLDDHLRRLELSQKILRFDEIITSGYVAEIVLELVRRNGFKESIHIRPTAYVAGEGESTARGPVALSVTAIPRGTPARVENGCRVQVSSWERLSDRSMPVRAKSSANYGNSRVAGIQAVIDGYDAALLLNRDGKISEGPAMCFFMIRDGVVVTPSITSDILESVTRATVIALFREHFDLATVERDIDRSELFAAEEAFFCGTGWEITPIVEIDGAPVGGGAVGAVTRQLQEAYFDLVTKAAPDRWGWLTPV